MQLTLSPIEIAELQLQLKAANQDLEHERTKYDQLERERDELLRNREAANQRIAELEKQLALKQIGLDAVNGPKLYSAEQRAEAAESQLETARRDVLDLVCSLNPWIDRARMGKALAQIDAGQKFHPDSFSFVYPAIGDPEQKGGE
jgi:chromosome segregation ATPase